MRKKRIRGFGLLAFCFLASAIPVKAADAPITLTKEGDEVKVVLSKEAIEDEVHSLHLSFEIEVAQGELEEASFQWAVREGVYTKVYQEREGGHIILDVYASAKEDLFSPGDGRLTLGAVKLTASEGGATTLVKAENLNTVNGVQELTSDAMSFAEVTAGDGGSGSGQGPEDWSGGSGSGDNNGDNIGSGSNGSNTEGNSGFGPNGNSGSGPNGNSGSGPNGSISANPGLDRNDTLNMAPTAAIAGNKGKAVANKIKHRADTAGGATDAPAGGEPEELKPPEDPEEKPKEEEGEHSSPPEEDSSDLFREAMGVADEEGSGGMGQELKLFLMVCGIIVILGGIAAAVLLNTSFASQGGRPGKRSKKGGKKRKKNK